MDGRSCCLHSTSHRAIDSYSLRIVIRAHLTCISMPPLEGPHRNTAMTFGTEKLEWCGYQTVTNFEDMFILFDRMYEHDRQTDTA